MGRSTRACQDEWSNFVDEQIYSFDEMNTLSWSFLPDEGGKMNGPGMSPARSQAL